MIIALPKEILPNERRVALTPSVVKILVKKGLDVHVEAGAGLGVYLTDNDYETAGAKIKADPLSLLSKADVVVKIHRPLFNEKIGQHECALMKEGAILIGLLQALKDPEGLARLNKKKISAFAMEFLPRITRAQQMDILSAMSSLAGYKAVLLAAASFGKFFPMMTTAAGTIAPAKVFIIGAGVAGLQAIATARRLGAVVEAFDTRPVAKEQVMSLGAKFVELSLDSKEGEGSGGYARALSERSHQQELELIHARAKVSDIIITSALIPGKKAPVLITEKILKAMKKGSVIVDLAAAHGGNCTLTEADKEIIAHGVTIIGASDLAATMPIDASQMLAKNMSHFILHLYRDKCFDLDLNDEITSGTLITHQGEIVNATVKAAFS